MNFVSSKIILLLICILLQDNIALGQISNQKFFSTHPSLIFMNKSLLKNSETIQTSRILNRKVELKNANSMFLKQSNDPTENSAAS